jgi:hypothetical protein
MFVIQQDFDFARQSNQASSGGGTTGSSEAAPLGQFGCLPDKERKKKNQGTVRGDRIFSRDGDVSASSKVARRAILSMDGCG